MGWDGMGWNGRGGDRRGGDGRGGDGRGKGIDVEIGVRLGGDAGMGGGVVG